MHGHTQLFIYVRERIELNSGMLFWGEGEEAFFGTYVIACAKQCILIKPNYSQDIIYVLCT